MAIPPLIRWALMVTECKIYENKEEAMIGV